MEELMYVQFTMRLLRLLPAEIIEFKILKNTTLFKFNFGAVKKT